MTDVEAVPHADEESDLDLVASLVVALVVGGALAATAYYTAVGLLVAVAATQALLAAAWVYGTGLPGRNGALVIAGLASAGADIAVSVWPHGRLGTLLVVLGLAVPVMFVHQLMRGAARLQVVSSLSGVAMLVFAEVSLPAMVQLRHEFAGRGLGGRVTATAIGAMAGALVIGYLVDLLFAAPRFDPAVPRGLLALIASAGLGGSIGYLALRSETQFIDGRATFVGAALGALAGLVAVGAAFALHTTPVPSRRLAQQLRAAIGAVLPLCVVSPPAFLLCLAIRS